MLLLHYALFRKELYPLVFLREWAEKIKKNRDHFMKIDTPCIGVCSTIYGDDICRGCKRTYTEIIAWNTYSDDEKQWVFNRLATEIHSVMHDKIEIIDTAYLLQQLKEQNIRYREEDSPLCWAYHLLRVVSDKASCLINYKILVKPLYQKHTLRQLFTLIDKELWVLANS